jgi:SMC interacting uncharacterized protein involved in chromosome segregation
MSWAAEALAALRKVITLEERVVTLADDMKELTRLLTDLDRRLVRLETKFEVYEHLREKGRPRRLSADE